MQEIKLVVFDLAGTVIEDAGQVPAAFAAGMQALRAHAVRIDDQAVCEPIDVFVFR